MAMYLITCDLNNEDGDYSDLVEGIEEYDAYCNIFGTQWFVCSEGSAEDIQEDLTQYLYEGDFVLVCDFNGNYAGWLPEQVVEWVERNR